MAAVTSGKPVVIPLGTWAEDFRQKAVEAIETSLRPFIERTGHAKYLFLITRLASHKEDLSSSKLDERIIISHFPSSQLMDFSKLMEIIRKKFHENVLVPTSQLIENPHMCKMRFIVVVASPKDEVFFAQPSLELCELPHHCPKFQQEKEVRDFIESTAIIKKVRDQSSKEKKSAAASKDTT